MFEELHFLRETVLKIDAAVVGISRSRWEAIPSAKATPEAAAAIMKRYRFDVLPIDDGDESRVTSYFHGERWNDYSSVSRRYIAHHDVIPFDTSIREVIKGFAMESTDFYFLLNETRIVGLISVVNLNCRQVKLFLFSLLSDLETCLGDYLLANVPESEILESEFGASATGRAAEIRDQYRDDQARGYDVPVVEYLYLSNLINLVATRKLYSGIGYKSRKAFDDCLGPLNVLRNQVAHGRSLITDENSCKRLWNNIDHIEEALFVLRQR